jgi:glycerol-1-phosphate dehydrogenase [NAD(P)+]
MPASTLDQLLRRFGTGRAEPCSCGRAHGLGVREVLVGQDALERSAALLRRLHGASPSLWVLSDANTEAAAGERWKRAVTGARIASRVLPASPRPVPTAALVDQLSAEVRGVAPGLLVGVGSGVISDLVKAVSQATGLPSWCVGTAPSVDAYGSATAAIRVAGYHRSLPVRPSEVIVCDLGVMAAAPRLLFLAGLGDLLAKFLASLDWQLAEALTGEHRCEPVAGFALGSARAAIEAARAWSTSPLEAVGALTEAALVSGLAMQAVGSSRPAASAEHTIAHFWEMAGAVGSAELDLHGLLAGAASRLVLRGYSSWYGALGGLALDVPARLTAFDAATPGGAAESMEPGLLPFREVVEAQAHGHRLDRDELARRLSAFGRERGRLVDLAAPLLEEVARAVVLLEGLGFPFSLDVLRIEASARLLPVRNVRRLRQRYTTFDLAWELGQERELVAAVAQGA